MTRMFNPAHPGEELREYLPPDLTVTEAAQRLRVSRLTSTTAESWLNNQVQGDLWQASQRPLPQVEPLPRVA